MAEEKDDFGLSDIKFKPIDPDKYYEDRIAEENSNSGKIIVGIVVLLLFVGALLVYKFVWIPRKEKAVLEQPMKEEPVKWIYETRSQSGGTNKVGLLTIEQHLYIVTQAYGNGIRLVHSESCSNPKHITK